MKYSLKFKSEKRKEQKQSFNTFNDFAFKCANILSDIEQTNDIWILKTNHTTGVAYRNNKQKVEFISLELFKRRFSRNETMINRINKLI